MAEEKGAASSGGFFGDWDPFVVVVGVLLLIALLSRLRGESPKASPAPKKIEWKQAETLPPEDSCGLLVTRPRPFETITSRSVVVSGSVGSCEWATTGNVALYVQVVDASGKLLSAYTPLMMPGAGSQLWPDTLSEGVPFSQLVVLTGEPESATGFIIFVHPDTDRSVSKTVRVPVRFRVPLVY